MDEHLLTLLKHDIEERYRRKYGPITIHFDELTLEAHERVRVRFTISKEAQFVTRYSGTATYLAQHWFLDAQPL